MFYLRTLLMAVLTAFALCSIAQRPIVVLDMDTGLPVRDVSVRVDNGAAKQTDYLGRTSVPILFDSIMFSHVRYESERLNYQEVRDTMYLLPIEHMLPEVQVTELNPQTKSLISSWAKIGAMMGAAEAPKGVASFDFASMLDRRGRRDKKHLERAKKILKDWDKKKVE